MESDFEKILAPDIVDPRLSTEKALPSRPITAKRVMRQYRFSAVIPFAFAVIAFALTMVLVVSGRKPGELQNGYMVAINSSNVGANIIRFEQATSTSASPSATSSSASTNPLDPLNPFSTSSPLNPSNPLSNLSSILDPLVGNLTDTINNGAEDAVNEIVTTLISSAGVKDFYYLYLETICEGSASSSGSDGVILEDCSSYDDTQGGLNAIVNNIQSSVVIGTTNVSVPLVAELTHSLTTVSGGIAGLRKATFAFLIIPLIGSGLSAISALPAIFFPHSRLLIYANLFWPSLAATFGFLAACILTALIVGIAQTVGGIGDAVSLYIKQGNKMLVYVWLGWLFVWLDSMYWFAVWFVEVRSWAFVKRRRTQSEKEDWRGICREMKNDIRGKNLG
ncbi:hypothetical protein BDV96DRAFT_605924 [Lophiotrema nucula]|uniref:Actin cortical patch SUR7/pH-response regulator pali n=1 Tax=Lophiotrema nucula TaxID=690887 RepID=A0A6A5YPY9_9PLEO|nr:hypothetical protein BDV96DRAFT_605924 [Lophiotrema nucula]